MLKQSQADKVPEQQRVEAATLCNDGCNRMQCMLQPHVKVRERQRVEAATLCTGGCNRMQCMLSPYEKVREQQRVEELGADCDERTTSLELELHEAKMVSE